MSGLRQVLSSSSDKPLLGKALIVMALCGALGGALGWAFDVKTVGLSIFVSFVLGMIVATSPMRMALALVGITGALLVVSATLGVAFAHNALMAALVMAVIAFASAAWSSIAVVGGFFSSLPVLVYVLMTAKAESFVGTSAVWKAAVAAMIGVAAAALVAVLVSIRDPRKADRTITAASWSTDLPANKRGQIVRVLFLDRAPRALQTLSAQAALSVMIHRWFVKAGVTEPAAAFAQADANRKAIAGAIVPPGRITPRKVSIDTDALTAAAKATSGQQQAVWQLWAQTFEQARVVLGGELILAIARHPLLALARGLLRSLMHPDVAVFRFALQRVLALSVGIFALVLSDGKESYFWVLLTMMSVLQLNAPATFARNVQRAAGTLGGVLLAVVVSLILPKEVLDPWLAGIAMLAGIVWIMRNYAVASMLIAMAVVLLMGVPKGNVAGFAVMRAMDVVIGGAIALLISRFFFHVKARPAQRQAASVGALRAFVAELREVVSSSGPVPLQRLIDLQSAVVTSLGNQQSDIQLLRGDEQAAAQKNYDELVTLSERAYAVASAAVGIARVPVHGALPLESTLESLDSELAALS